MVKTVAVPASGWLEFPVPHDNRALDGQADELCEQHD
jgi:hypothetical protein